MTTLSQFPRPEAGQYAGRRKLFLVPLFALPPGVPEDGTKLLERYWSEVRDHVTNLERSLGAVSHVFHETVFSEGDEGLKMVEALNPGVSAFVQAMCRSTASLEATEDRDLVEENSDWQRCISIGLMSQKVISAALDGYRETTQKRFEHMGSRIEETLGEGEVGVLFVREDHSIQFPSDIQVFYVAPPGLDALKRWMDAQVRPAAQAGERAQETGQPEDQATAADSPAEPEDADEDGATPAAEQSQ
ncbi:MAG: hypothetical protein IH862_10450 [Chloroflexi bacterium]|nr:hypothetical protein [Chloroflexota bacterium]